MMHSIMICNDEQKPEEYPDHLQTLQHQEKNRKIDMYCFVCPTQLSVMLTFSSLDFCRLYKVYNKPVFRGIVYFCAWLLLCLAFFEDPAVPGMGLPYWVSQDIIKS